MAGEARKRMYTSTQAEEAKTLVTQYVTTLGFVLAPVRRINLLSRLCIACPGGQGDREGATRLISPMAPL